mmetsp:Transcript_16747/g.36260  ORF Transcript_16747/g.36260 Transcript_16747/m.36260 type:complete len:146 (+) Transcript_16747:156-593(+)
MNSSRPIIQRLLHRPPLHRTTTIIIPSTISSTSISSTTSHHHQNHHHHHHYSTTTTLAAMPPGIPIPGLESIYPKNQKDPSKSKAPIVLKREEYPSWVSELSRPLPTLAKLRNRKIEEASDGDRKRYLKLMRKAKIKQNNLERAK